jgi:hypothetical protein
MVYSVPIMPEEVLFFPQMRPEKTQESTDKEIEN